MANPFQTIELGAAYAAKEKARRRVNRHHATRESQAQAWEAFRVASAAYEAVADRLNGRCA